MRDCFLSLSFILLLTGGCDSKNAKKRETATESAPSAVINEKAVWKGNPDKCFEVGAGADCLLNTVKEKGTPAAVKAVQYLAEKGETGYIADFKKEGPLGIATVVCPFRANTNSAILLVPATGSPVDLEKITSVVSADPGWRAFEKRHPGSVPWSPATLIKTEYTDKGIEFIFSYPVRICHACENIAAVFLSYQFSREGRLINYRVAAVKSSD